MLHQMFESLEHGRTCREYTLNDKHSVLRKQNAFKHSNILHYIKPVEQTFAKTGVQSMVNNSLLINKLAEQMLALRSIIYLLQLGHAPENLTVALGIFR